MTCAKQRLTWLLSGVVFLMVVAAAGCTGTSHPSTAPESKVAIDAYGSTVASSAEPVFDVLRSEPNAPKINLFGEFDGVPRPPVRRGGEAGFQQHTYVDEGYDGDVSVDPKGQWLVFSSTRHSEHTDLYLQKVDGLSVTQLTDDEADDAFPVFSPDGNRVAFCSTRSGTWDIYTMDADGRNAVQVTSSPMQELHPSFSPDGNRLAYCAMSNRSGQWELWTVNLLTGERQMIGFGLFPTWSPNKDIDQIAFQKARARGSRWFSAWTLDLVNGEARRVTEVAVSSNAAIVSPSWSPDGKKLSFATVVEPAQMVSGQPTGQQDIWTVNVDGTNRHRITDGNGICAAPYWGADNRIYFVSDRGGAESIWSARVGPSDIATVKTDTGDVAGN